MFMALFDVSFKGQSVFMRWQIKTYIMPILKGLLEVLFGIIMVIGVCAFQYDLKTPLAETSALTT